MKFDFIGLWNKDLKFLLFGNFIGWIFFLINGKYGFFFLGLEFSFDGNMGFCDKVLVIYILDVGLYLILMLNCCKIVNYFLYIVFLSCFWNNGLSVWWLYLII